MVVELDLLNNPITWIIGAIIAAIAAVFLINRSAQTNKNTGQASNPQTPNTTTAPNTQQTTVTQTPNQGTPAAIGTPSNPVTSGNQLGQDGGVIGAQNPVQQQINASISAQLMADPTTAVISEAQTQALIAANKLPTYIFQVDSTTPFNKTSSNPYVNPTVQNKSGFNNIGAPTPSYDSFLDWTKKVWGSSSDPLGLNGYIKSTGGNQFFVQYVFYTPTVSTPQVGTAGITNYTPPVTGQSGGSVIYNQAVAAAASQAFRQANAGLTPEQIAAKYS